MLQIVFLRVAETGSTSSTGIFPNPSSVLIRIHTVARVIPIINRLIVDHRLDVVNVEFVVVVDLEGSTMVTLSSDDIFSLQNVAATNFFLLFLQQSFLLYL